MLNGYKGMIPLEIGTHKMAEHATGGNTRFLLLIQQVDSEFMESSLKHKLSSF